MSRRPNYSCTFRQYSSLTSTCLQQVEVDTNFIRKYWILPSDIWPVLWCSSSQSLCSGRSHPWQSWWRHNCSWRWWCQGSHWSHHNISQLRWSSRCLRPWSQDSHIYSSNFPQCQSLCSKINSENQTDLFSLPKLYLYHISGLGRYSVFTLSVLRIICRMVGRPDNTTRAAELPSTSWKYILWLCGQKAV